MNIIWTLVAIVTGSQPLAAPIHNETMAEDKVVAKKLRENLRGKGQPLAKIRQKNEQKKPAADSKIHILPTIPWCLGARYFSVQYGSFQYESI